MPAAGRRLFLSRFMTAFHSLRVGQRLALGFGLVLALLALISGIGIRGMSHIEQQLTAIAEVNNRQSADAVAMRIAVNQVAIATRNVVLMDDVAAKREQLAAIEVSRKHYDEAEQRLGAMLGADPTTTAEEKRLFARIQEVATAARPLTRQVIELSMAYRTEEATQLLVTRAGPAQKPWLLTLGELAALEEKLNAEAAAAAGESYRDARAWMIGLSALALTVGAAIGLLLSRGLLRQLGGEPQDAADAARRIAEGDLTRDVAVRAGDTTSLIAAMGRMQGSLVRLVSDIRGSSDSIATGSTQIASGNADLSQRTEEQASNLQQTAASMEQLSSTVKHNADTARQATQLAGSASDAAARGGEAVGRVVETMSEISAASHKIADIIGVIDGIAFQTNILALNAAVEAARAGEQGRGFAVVAGEVRSLAQRSAQAAKEIKALIGDSVQKVRSGSDQVADAGRTMGDLVGQVRRVTDLIAEIGSATQEQSQGIGQVNDSVAQLDQVTQQNAALVEESAAAAESLRHQARQLVDFVSAFRVSQSAAADAQRAIERARAPVPVAAAPKRPSGAAMLAAAPARTAPAAAPAPAATPRTPAGGAPAADADWQSF